MTYTKKWKSKLEPSTTYNGFVFAARTIHRPYSKYVVINEQEHQHEWMAEINQNCFKMVFYFPFEKYLAAELWFHLQFQNWARQLTNLRFQIDLIQLEWKLGIVCSIIHGADRSNHFHDSVLFSLIFLREISDVMFNQNLFAL